MQEPKPYPTPYHQWRNPTKSEPYIYRTRNEHKFNFLKYLELKQSWTLIIKNPSWTQTRNFGSFAISSLTGHAMFTTQRSWVSCGAVAVAVAPMRGRGFGRGMGTNRGDMFRSRVPNTSRPPSMHVDDYIKMEMQGQSSSTSMPPPSIPPLSSEPQRLEVNNNNSNTPYVSGVTRYSDRARCFSQGKEIWFIGLLVKVRFSMALWCHRQPAGGWKTARLRVAMVF